MTALSLIFAVFRCNPSPVCVLDEVDAPLDDANVDRFCTLLEDMVRETATRFLVVTHHPLTMARMDRLYGVTMQERGVSRLLSVDLARAAEMAEPAAAGGGIGRRTITVARRDGPGKALHLGTARGAHDDMHACNWSRTCPLDTVRVRRPEGRPVLVERHARRPGRATCAFASGHPT